MANGTVLGFMSRVAARLGVAIVVAVVAVALAERGQPDAAYALGTPAIVYDNRANAFVGEPRDRQRVQVIDSGLEDASGLASDPGANRIYFAAAWDAIGTCSLTRRGTDSWKCSRDKSGEDVWLPPIV